MPGRTVWEFVARIGRLACRDSWRRRGRFRIRVKSGHKASGMGAAWGRAAQSRAMFTIIGAMAELEASLISERVTAGMRAAEAQGKPLRRPATPPRLSRRSRCSPGQRAQHPANSEDERRARQSRHRRRDHKTSARRTASGLVTTFYTYPEPTPTSSAAQLGSATVAPGTAARDDRSSAAISSLGQRSASALVAAMLRAAPMNSL